MAFLSSGQPVWGMDAATREQWWYAPEHADDEVRDAIAAGLAGLGSGVDLAAHAPGHAVLAEIARLHAQAQPAADGMPGALSDDVVPWCVGFVGEEHVGAVLGGLGPGWHVLHAVPVGVKGSDIDHVVIGPGGVFTLNTKHHAGLRVDVKGDATFVAGRFVHHVADARKEAARADAALVAVGRSLRARPLIVTVGARLRVVQPPGDVVVLDSTRLAGWLRSQPAVLAPGQVEALHAALRWSSAWTSALPPAPAEPWVAPFARAMAAERELARSQATPARRSRRAPRTARRRPPVPTRASAPRRATRRALAALLSAALVVLVAVLGLAALQRIAASYADQLPGKRSTPAASAPGEGPRNPSPSSPRAAPTRR